MELRCQQRKQGQILVNPLSRESRDPRWQLSFPFPWAAPQSTGTVFITSHLLMIASSGDSQRESKVMTKLCAFQGSVC